MDTQARYEFRTWGKTLEDVKKRLLQLATPRHTETSEETYLISAVTDKCNAKIRHGMIDIKSLIEKKDGLERWRPLLKIGFPLKSSVIANDIFPNLNVQSPQLPKTEYGKAEFLNEVMSSQSQIAIVPVSKTRLQFTLKECQAEFASIGINGIALDTVAVEDSNFYAVWQLIREVGISGAANVNYIRQIKRVLGWPDHSSI